MGGFSSRNLACVWYMRTFTRLFVGFSPSKSTELATGNVNLPPRTQKKRHEAVAYHTNFPNSNQTTPACTRQDAQYTRPQLGEKNKISKSPLAAIYARDCRLAHPHNFTRSASLGRHVRSRLSRVGSALVCLAMYGVCTKQHLVCMHSLSQHLHEGVLLLVRAGLGLRHEEGAVVVQRDDVARLKVLHAQVHPLSRLHLVRDLTTITITTTTATAKGALFREGRMTFSDNIEKYGGEAGVRRILLLMPNLVLSSEDALYIEPTT